jgi:hypothetical protein
LEEMRGHRIENGRDKKIAPFSGRGIIETRR